MDILLSLLQVHFTMRQKLKNKYAGMLESVDWTDLGAVTSEKVFHFVTRTEKLNTRA